MVKPSLLCICPFVRKFDIMVKDKNILKVCLIDFSYTSDCPNLMSYLRRIIDRNKGISYIRLYVDQFMSLQLSDALLVRYFLRIVRI